MNIQSNAENNPSKNSPLIERERVENTPFTLIHYNDQWFLTMGDARITEPTKTKESTLEKLETHKWEILFAMIISSVGKILDKEWTMKHVVEEMGKDTHEGQPGLRYRDDGGSEQ